MSSCSAWLRIDCKELGNETLPVFVPEIRKFAQDNLGKIMSFYCEQEMVVVIVPVFVFFETLLSKIVPQTLAGHSFAGGECTIHGACHHRLCDHLHGQTTIESNQGHGNCDRIRCPECTSGHRPCQHLPTHSGRTASG